MARPAIPPEVLAHDADGREATRLLRGHHRSELLRTQDAVALHVAALSLAGLRAHHLAIATRP